MSDPTISRAKRSSQVNGLEMAIGLERYPLPLRAYRLLSAALAPFGAALLSHRRKQGKEHPTRVRERCGESDISRPPGPLAWIHCASVGELLTAIPLIARIRETGSRRALHF